MCVEKGFHTLSLSLARSSLLPELNGLLDRTEVSVRIAVGQAVGLLFELAREVDSPEPMDTSDGAETHELITQLATESSRYTARKERNQQRARFRDVLQTLEVCVYECVHALCV